MQWLAVVCDPDIQSALHNLQAAVRQLWPHYTDPPVAKKKKEMLNTDRVHTNLVSQNSYGASGGNFFLSKPHRGKVWRNTEDKHCGYWAHKLAKKGHWESIWTGTTDFYPSANAVKGWPDEDNIPDAPVVQEPEDGQNKWNVSEQINHGQPINSQSINVVETHEYVANNAIL